YHEMRLFMPSFYGYFNSIPRRIAQRIPDRRLHGLDGLATSPGVPAWPASWTPPAPTSTPQPNHCGISEQSALCAVDQLRPAVQQLGGSFLVGLALGAFIGWQFGGKE